MGTLTKDKAEYLIVFINEFARQYKLTSVQAYRYLSRFKAVNFLIDQYNIAHTQGFANVWLLVLRKDEGRRRG